MGHWSKYLRPERFEVEPTSTSADKKWLHWKQTFSNFLRHNFICSPGFDERYKFQLLTNYVGPNVYQYISESATFKDAMDTLESLYIKPRNEVYARDCLATRRQHAGESVDQDLQVSKQMSKDCNFKSVTAEQPIMNHHKDYEASLIPDEESSHDDAEGQIAYGTLDKLNKILVGQTRTMEFLAQLNNKLDTLLELNQECQTRIGVVETRIQSLEEAKKEAATTSYPSTSTTSDIL